MSSNLSIHADIPEVPVTLEFHSSLDRVLGTGELLNEAFQRTVIQAFVELLETLGIPGRPVIEIALAGSDRFLGNQFIRVSVNDGPCRYPDELLQSLHGYVNDTQPQLASPVEILSWLHELADEQSEMAGPNREKLVEFLSLSCLAIVKLNPAVLLGLAQTGTYIATLPAPAEEKIDVWPPEAAWLLPILGTVLDLKISIANQQAIADVLHQAHGRSQDDVAEDLIAALRPHVVEVQLPCAYLKQLTTSDAGDGISMFSFMRDGLFVELGLQYPAFRFVTTERLKPNSFAFQINHLTIYPFIGLQFDQCLVNDTAERLKLMNVEGYPAMNTATGQPASVVNLSWKEMLEAAGLTTWNQMGYLILCFADILRKNGACFIDEQAALSQLDQLEEEFLAVKAAKSKLSMQQITRVLRALAADELSIRNLIQILERLLDYDFLRTEPSQPVSIDEQRVPYGSPSETWLDEFADLVSFTRAGMRRYISNKYARGTRTLVVYLLDPKIEKMLVGRDSSGANEKKRSWLYGDEGDAVLDAIGKEITYLPPTALTPALLTTDEVRPGLAELVRYYFPRMSVISFQELSPEMNIKPVARISL
jgi:flagellar biosynthesis component FlhA